MHTMGSKFKDIKGKISIDVFEAPMAIEPLNHDRFCSYVCIGLSHKSLPLMRISFLTSLQNISTSRIQKVMPCFPLMSLWMEVWWLWNGASYCLTMCLLQQGMQCETESGGRWLKDGQCSKINRDRMIVGSAKHSPR